MKKPGLLAQPGLMPDSAVGGDQNFSATSTP
jgi:hypothetical protein